MSTPQTRPSTPVSAAAGNALTWGGPGDAVHLCYGGIADGDMEYPGEDMGRVSGRCHALKQAQAAVDAYVTGQRI